MYIELIIKQDQRVIEIMQQQLNSNSKFDFYVIGAIFALLDTEIHRWFHYLYQDCTLENGKILSKTERGHLGILKEKSFIYGEVEYNSFTRILQSIPNTQGGIFYDLGSGTGKAVFLASLNHDFDQCIGLEILQGLHDASERVLDRYKQSIVPNLGIGKKQDVIFHRVSFLEYDWSNGDVCFANSTCFDDTIMRQLSERGANMKPGSYFITFTKSLSSNRFEIVQKKRYAMSWGPATVFIHRKIF